MTVWTFIGFCQECNQRAWVNLQGKGWGVHMEIDVCDHVGLLLAAQEPDYSFTWKQIGVGPPAPPTLEEETLHWQCLKVEMTTTMLLETMGSLESQE